MKIVNGPGAAILTLPDGKFKVLTDVDVEFDTRKEAEEMEARLKAAMEQALLK